MANLNALHQYPPYYPTSYQQPYYSSIYPPYPQYGQGATDAEDKPQSKEQQQSKQSGTSQSDASYQTGTAAYYDQDQSTYNFDQSSTTTGWYPPNYHQSSAPYSQYPSYGRPPQ